MKTGIKTFIGIAAFGGLVVSALGITAAISHHKATAVHALPNGYAEGEYRYYNGNYYSSVTDAEITTGGTTLLGKLHDLIDNGKAFGYKNIWTFNEAHDCYPADYDGTDPLTGNHYPTTDNTTKRNKMWDMYCDKTWTDTSQRAGNVNSNIGVTYNREHSMPKSWFGGSDSNEPGTDPNHLFNTDGQVNNIRSNYPYGEVISVKTNCYTHTSGCVGFGKLGTNASGMTVFEPDDAYKGDFARAQMYMATAYYDWNLSQDSNGQLCFTYSNGHSTMKDYYINLLTKWSAQDPVSQKEIDRNNAVKASSMGNRNPFIDHPTWANRIWGGTTYTWNNGGESSGPDDPDPLPDPVENDSFRRITSEGALYAGDKIVVACNTLGKTAGSLSSSVLGSVGSTFSNDKSVITDLGDETTVFTLGGSSGEWTFSNDSDQLLGVTSEKKLSFGNGTTSWILTFGQTAVTMKTGNNNYGSMQYNSGSPRFTTYTSSQTAIQLYKQTKTIDRYCADFLSQTGEICKTNNQTDVEDLTDLWDNLSAQFAFVNETNQIIMKSLNNAAMQRYDYIVSKYHFDDFIDRQDNGQALAGEKVIYSTGIALAAIVVTSLGVAGGFAYFQKKIRENA